MIVTKIYRTPKGTLTFKEHGEPVMTVRSKTQLGADEMLQMMKQIDKRNGSI